MNKSLLFALVLAVPLAHVARADDHDNRSRKRPPQAAAQARSAAQQQAVRTAPRQSVPRMNPLNPPRRVSSATRGANSNVVRRPAVQNSRPVYQRPAISRTTSNPLVNNGRSRNRDRATNPRVKNNAGAQNNRANANRNRPNRTVNRNSFADARHRGVRGNHNRNWWRSHYNTTFVLFGGGYYYWDTGYWFPAYGYDPYYNNYAYDEPIYGYNDLAPGQVLENVQIALRDLGYYHGPIDGLIGPQTRAALGDYQNDNGLVITEAVDEPTLATLGLT